MRKLIFGAAAAAAIAVATPALAQVGFYAGPGGVGIDVGRPHGYYHERGRNHHWDRGRHEGRRHYHHQNRWDGRYSDREYDRRKQATEDQ